VLTWLSPVGNRIDECGDLFQIVSGDTGGEEAKAPLSDLSNPTSA
jgi:hypothetical protein